MLTAWLRKGSSGSAADVNSSVGATAAISAGAQGAEDKRKRPAEAVTGDDDVALAPVPASGTCATTPTPTVTAATQRRALAYNQVQPGLTNSDFCTIALAPTRSTQWL